MQPEPETRAAIYTRVSTGGQVDGSSLGTQLEDCRGVATRRGWDVVEEFVEAGVSGAKESRPALDRMLDLAAAGKVDVVVVAKLDRLGRSAKHLLQMVETLTALKVRIVAVSEGIDSATAAGRMQLGMVGVLAEFERDRIADRVITGLRARVAAGGFVGSSPPFGYRAVPDPSGRGVVLAQDPAQAATIRRIYRRLILDRIPMDRVMRELNQAGHRSDTGRPWTRSALATWVRRKGPSTVAGTWSWGGVEVPIPPILSAAELMDWREWLDETASAQSPRGPYLLSRMITGACGVPLQGRTVGSQAPTYACPNHVAKRKTDPTRCDCANIHAGLMDDLVWTQIEGLLTDSSAIAALVSEMEDGQVGDRVSDLDVSRARDLLAELQKLVITEFEAAVADGWDAGMARQMVRGRQAEVKAAAAAVKAATRSGSRARKSSAGADRFAALTTLLAGQFEALTVEDRQQVLRAVGLQVTIAGYEECPTCSGRGALPLPPGSGRGWPPICPGCRRMRQIPTVELRVTLPQALMELASVLSEQAG